MSAGNDESVRLLELAGLPELFAELDSLSGSELSVQTQLRGKYPPELVRMALTQRDLRRKGAEKFSLAQSMWFDRTGLEQATAEQVALHKARRFAGQNVPVLDLCSGIGMDSIALALSGCRVTSVDNSPVAGTRLRLNAAAYGVSDRIEFCLGNVENVDVSGRLVHLDPDRRQGRGRAVRLEDYQPSLDFMQNLTRQAAGGAIKLSPAANFGGKFADCEIELVSLNGECKEATVWFGSLRTSEPMRATVLPGGWTLTADPMASRPRIVPLQRYLFDPDPAVVRSGLLDVFADQSGLARLDGEEEFLTADRLIATPGATGFEVLESLPNNLGEIAGYFRSHPAGEIEIKCRHVPIDVERTRRKLPRSGKDRAVLIFTRLQGKTRAIVCRRQIAASDETARR